MANKENSLAHMKWMCKYHIVFTPKYRRKAIYNQYKQSMREILKQLYGYKGHDLLLKDDHENVQYLMFASTEKRQYDVSNFRSDSGYYLSQILITPYKFITRGAVACDGSSVSASEYRGLYDLIGNSFGGNSTRFALPDYNHGNTVDGINYVILSKGSFPLNRRIDSILVNYINYVPVDYGYNDVSLLGEIILAKGIDQSIYGDELLPCDGRELSVSEYIELYTLLRSTFGGDDITTFAIPDFSSVEAPLSEPSTIFVTMGVILLRISVTAAISRSVRATVHPDHIQKIYRQLIKFHRLQFFS